MGNNKKNHQVISIPSAREATLRRKVRQQLHLLGFHKSNDGALEIGGDDKEVVRSLHGPQRFDRLSASSNFLSRRAPKLIDYFASGLEVSSHLRSNPNSSA